MNHKKMILIWQDKGGTMSNVDILSDDFFKELFSINDELAIERKFIEYVAVAKEQKIKSQFEKMYNLYKKEARKQRELEFENNKESFKTNISDFKHPKYKELKSYAWQCDYTGVKTQDFNGEVIACSHPIMPVEVLQNIQTKKEKVKIAYKRRGIWKEQLFNRSDISSSNKIITALADYGISVNSNNANNLVKYLSEIESYNENDIKVQKSTSKMGWYEGEFIPYTTDNKILFDAENSFETLYQSLTQKGSKDLYMDHMKKIRKSKRDDVKFAIAASLASILVQPLGILPFIFHMYGLGGKGKTVAFMVASSIWGDPNEGAFLADAKSTKTAFEMRLNFLNNLPLICDDLSQLKRKSEETDFSEFIYMVCSGRGNERSNVNLGLNGVTTWKNAILTNAEKPITTEISNGGEILRVIDFQIENGELFENAKETADIIKQNYGFLGKEFIKIVQSVDLKKIFEQIIAKIGKDKESKQVYSMASIILADYLIDKYIFKDGMTLNFNKCVSLIKSPSQMNDNERAMEFIINQFNLHENRFSEHALEIWGRKLNNKICINPSIFDDWAIKGNFTKKIFMKWAVENGFAEIDKEDGRTTKKVKIDGKSKNYVVILLPSDDDFTEMEGIQCDDLPF